MKKKSSLKLKAILLISVVFIVLVSAVTYVQYTNSKKLILSSLENSGKQTVTIHAQNLSSWVKSRLSQVQVIANTELVSSMDYTKILPYFAREQKNYDGVFNSIGISDSKGKLTLGGNVTVDISSESTFPQVMNGESIISDPFAAKESPSDLIISMECPVKNISSNKVEGLVSGACLVSTVFKENTNFHIGSTDQVYILNKNGTVLYHPDSKQIGTNLLESSNKELSGQVKNSLSGESHMGQYMDGGTTKMLFSSHVDGTNWYMLLEVPTQEYTASLSALLYQIVFVTSVAVVVLILLMILFLQLFFRRLSKISAVAGQVADGCLTDLLPESTDELGRINIAFNRMIRNLKDIIVKIRSVSNVMEESSGNCKRVSTEAIEEGDSIRLSIKEVTLAAKSTAEEIQNITMSMDEMEQKSQMLADISTSIDEMIAQTSSQTSSGSKTMDSAVQTLEKMKTSVNLSSKIITELAQRSKTIAGVTTAIAAISNQTNILALNANIEAARAGKDGRGFSVVANEVRNLAGQSAEASQKISQEIGNIQQQIEGAVTSMEDSIRFVEQGTDAIKNMREIFSRIETEMIKIKSMSSDISKISGILMEKNKQIHGSVANTSAVSEESVQNTMSFESMINNQEVIFRDLKEASEHLDELSESLSREIARFKTD